MNFRIFKITSFVSSHETRRPLFITNILLYFLLLFYNVKKSFCYKWQIQIRFTFEKNIWLQTSLVPINSLMHIIPINFLSWLMIDKNKFELRSSREVADWLVGYSAKRFFLDSENFPRLANSCFRLEFCWKRMKIHS